MPKTKEEAIKNLLAESLLGKSDAQIIAKGLVIDLGELSDFFPIEDLNECLFQASRNFLTKFTELGYNAVWQTVIPSGDLRSAVIWSVTFERH